VWVIDPERRGARVYRLDGSAAVASAHEALHGEDVVPGFVCSLSAML
jgi:Uma2 family endonuclease